jgi:aminopeptidase 2
VLYSPERLSKIAAEASKGDAVFSADDRIELVGDVAALAKAGFIDTSAALAVTDQLRNESQRESHRLFPVPVKEANETTELVWSTISGLTGTIKSTWYENERVVDGVAAFQRVGFPCSPLCLRHGLGD